MIAFIFIIYYFVKQSIKTIKINKNAGFSMLLIMLYMIINTLAETAFFNPASLLLFILFGLFEAEAELEKEAEYN